MATRSGLDLCRHAAAAATAPSSKSTGPDWSNSRQTFLLNIHSIALLLVSASLWELGPGSRVRRTHRPPRLQRPENLCSQRAERQRVKEDRHAKALAILQRIYPPNEQRAWFVAPRSSLNMDVLDHSDDEEEQGQYATSNGRSSSRLGACRRKRRSGGSHQHLLLMDCVGGRDGGDGALEDTVPLPDYERLSQSEPVHDDAKHPPPALLLAVEEEEQEQQKAPAKQGAASRPQPPQLPLSVPQQQKPAAWRLIEYVRSRNRSGGAGAGPGACGAGSDGDSKSSEDGSEEGKKDKKKKKKRSSWLPDPDRRWPVQGFY